MNRKDLATRIAEISFHQNGYAFGGYVRDLVAQESFKDIDLFLGENDANINKFIYELKSRRCFVQEMCVSPLYIPGLVRRKFSVQDSTQSTEVEIDCVVSIDGTNTPFRKGYDVDVNYLFFDEIKGVQAADWYDLNVLLKHIEDRKFTAEKTVLNKRIQKMLAKGYSRIDSSERAEGFTRMSSCPECKGNGVLDFGFYKRDCGCKESSWSYSSVF